MADSASTAVLETGSSSDRSSSIFSLGLEAFWGENAHAVGRADKPELRDPVPAILDLVRQTQTKGIELMLVLVPPKIAIYPDQIGTSLPEDYRSSTDARPSAGLPDHLAFELGFGVDLVGVRGSGATAARLNLFRRRDPLSTKRSTRGKEERRS